MEPFDIRSPRVRWTLFAAAAVAIIAMISTCRSIPDNVLGAREGANETANCISDCAHSANEAIRVESDRHVEAVHACDGDATCLAQEDARHTAAVDAIQDGRKACQENCRHQGGGKGGR
jgi:hypothetical protein